MDNNWLVKDLGSVAERVTKGATPTSYGFKYLDSGIRFIKVENIRKGRIDLDSIKHFISEEANQNQKRSILEEGDILFSIAGTIGSTCLVIQKDLPANTNQALAIIRGTSAVLFPPFLQYQLSAQTTRDQASEKERGGGMHNVSLEDVKNLSILIPPYNEQRRIVAKLETLLGKVDACQKRLERIPIILKRFRQSVLAAACSGRLTEDWRELNPAFEPALDLLAIIAQKRKIAYQSSLREATKNGDRKPRKILPDAPPVIDSKETDLPETWTMTNVGFLAHVTKLAGFEYTKHIKLLDDGDVPVVRAQNVQMGRFVEENIKYISKSIADFLERSQLHEREILMVFIGAGTGNVCMAPKGRWHLAPNVAKIDVDGVNTSYLLLYLQSPVGFSYMASWIKATAQPSLSMETIREIVVHLPPLLEQQEIVRRVEALFSFADQIEARYQKAKAHVDKMTQSILAKAFRGELVPQDPNDEPASALLERIRMNEKQDRNHHR